MYQWELQMNIASRLFALVHGSVCVCVCDYVFVSVCLCGYVCMGV